MKSPIPHEARRIDNTLMVRLTIRCHPLVPVDADELERWLELEVHDLRADAPQGIIRLSRLQSADLNVGWLIELEIPEGQPLLARDRLVAALRDMNLLGLQPTVLGPIDLSEWSPPIDNRVPVVRSPVHSANGDLDW
jgi:hypothetical protein